MILSIESATAVCSVALSSEGRLLAIRELNEGFSHAEKLTVFIQEVITEAGVSLKELKAVAVSSGPGSYTGLRIGVSAAKGLCYALDIPLISVDTLLSMAAGAVNAYGESVLYCPLLDARRMEVYCAVYDAHLKVVNSVEAKVVDEYFLEDVVRDAKVVLFGDGAAKCKPLLMKNENFIFIKSFTSARFVSVIAEEKFTKGEFENLALFEPFYLKEFIPGPKKNS